MALCEEFSIGEAGVSFCLCWYLSSSFHFNFFHNTNKWTCLYLLPVYVLVISPNQSWIYLIHRGWRYRSLVIFLYKFSIENLYLQFVNQCVLFLAVTLNIALAIGSTELVATKWMDMCIMLLRNQKCWWLESGMSWWVINPVTWKGNRFLALNWKRLAIHLFLAVCTLLTAYLDNPVDFFFSSMPLQRLSYFL